MSEFDELHVMARRVMLEPLALGLSEGLGFINRSFRGIGRHIE